MSNPIEILKQIKAIVFNDVATPAPVEVEQKFDEYTLVDGTPVMISELVIGGVVTLADGTAAPAGDHTLADGTVITVGEGGVISNIMAPAEAVPVMEVTPEEIEAGKNYEEKDEEKVKMGELEDKMAMIESKLAKAEEAIKSLVALVETLVKEPSTMPVESVKSGFKHASKENRQDKIAKLFSQIKK
jgi:hypothetical protein